MGISVNLSVAPPVADSAPRSADNTTQDATPGGGFEEMFAAMLAPGATNVVDNADTPPNLPIAESSLTIGSHADVSIAALTLAESAATDLSRLATTQNPINADSAGDGENLVEPAESILPPIDRVPQVHALEIATPEITAIPVAIAVPPSAAPAATIGELIRTNQPGLNVARKRSEFESSRTGIATGAEAAQATGTNDFADAKPEANTRGSASALQLALQEIPAMHPAPAAAVDVLETKPAPPRTGELPQAPTVATTPASPAPASRELELKVPQSSPVWREAFSSQVNILIGERVQAAEMRLHPPELGPVDIRISVSDQQTSIAFTATHEDTRRAIEDAIPRLRELLAESGIQLGNTSVEGERTPQDTHGKGSTTHDRRLPQDEPADTETAVRTVTVRAPRGLIDTFA